MSEQKLQTKCINYLEGLGAYVVKVVSASRAGVPDVLVCYQGKYIAFEFKDDGNKATALQEYNICRIKKAGGSAFVIRSLNELIERLKAEATNDHN